MRIGGLPLVDTWLDYNDLMFLTGYSKPRILRYIRDGKLPLHDRETAIGRGSHPRKEWRLTTIKPYLPDDADWFSLHSERKDARIAGPVGGYVANKLLDFEKTAAKMKSSRFEGMALGGELLSGFCDWMNGRCIDMDLFALDDDAPAESVDAMIFFLDAMQGFGMEECAAGLVESEKDSAVRADDLYKKMTGRG